MATGDSQDCLARIKSTLAPWFGNAPTPILDALLSGPAAVLSWGYGVIAYARLQLRLTTASDGWLDLIAQDFFGPHLRRAGDADNDYRLRIQATMFRPCNTLTAISAAVRAVTGNAPSISETSFAIAIDVNPGPASTAVIQAAINAVRPICCVVTLTLGSGSSFYLETEDGSDFFAGDGGDILLT